MALSRICSLNFTRQTLSKLNLSLDNGQHNIPSKINVFRPLLPCSNLPSVTCISGKKTVAEELGLPEPPKRPASPFLRFVMNEGKKYPQTSVAEKAVKLSHEWAVLEDSKKQPYLKNYDTEHDLYQKRLQEYYRFLTPEQVQDLKTLKLKRKNEKKATLQRRKLRKEGELLGKPKHPGNALTLFIDSIKDTPQFPKENMLKYSSEKWKSLSDQERDSFKQKASKKLKQYKEELTSWEAKMRAQGREDLVSTSSQKVSATLSSTKH